MNKLQSTNDFIIKYNFTTLYKKLQKKLKRNFLIIAFNFGLAISGIKTEIFLP